MSALSILKEAREALAYPSRWGQGRRGRDRLSDTFCVAEAIEECPSCVGSTSRNLALKIFRAAANITDGAFVDGAFVEWNDAPERTHSEVIANLNLAIALARNYPATD